MGSMALLGCGKAPVAAPAGPVFAFKGTDQTVGGTSVFTSTTVDIGAASADRLVILATADQNGNSISTVTVNGVTLTQDNALVAGPAMQIWSGVVNTGSGPATIVVNYSGAAFTGRVLNVWTGTGLSSNLVKHTATITSPASSTSISVTAGDFLIAVDIAGGSTFSTSTETPTVERSNALVTPPTLMSAEWNTIVATNASFTIQSSLSSVNAIVASYR